MQGSPWEKCRTAIFTHRSFNFDKRELGFLIFSEGCKQECYPKVHQNIHSVQTRVWLSKLWVLSCEKLFLSQAIICLAVQIRGYSKIVPSARPSLQMDICSGSLFFFLSLQTRVSGHPLVPRSCALWHRMPEVTEWERGPRVVFVLCGEK